MIDTAEKQSLEIDTKKLSKLLNVPVVPVKAVQKQGIDELAKEAIKLAETQKLVKTYRGFLTAIFTTTQIPKRYI